MTRELINHVENEFGISFQNENLLIEAFTHSSYANDHRDQGIKNLERLEFLGDAVLELTVSEYLFNQYPTLPEGRLTRMRAAVVRAESLSQFAKQCQFAQYVRLGRGEEQSNGRERPSLLCDVFEAFIGAVFLDQGMEIVLSFLGDIVFPRIDAGDFSHGMDFKTALQETVQKNGVVRIQYEVIDTKGPDHAREFIVEVRIEDDVLGTGSGRSKKVAEQQAAKQALEVLSDVE